MTSDSVQDVLRMGAAGMVERRQINTKVLLLECSKRCNEPRGEGRVALSVRSQIKINCGCI